MIYDRALLVAVMTYHARRANASCLCGWARLGAGHPDHVLDVYEDAVRKGLTPDGIAAAYFAGRRP